MLTVIGASMPWVSHSLNIQASAAMAVAICVVAIAMPAVPFAATALPALKPNQPTHRMQPPTSVKVRLCGASSSLR